MIKAFEFIRVKEDQMSIPSMQNASSHLVDPHDLRKRISSAANVGPIGLANLYLPMCRFDICRHAKWSLFGLNRLTHHGSNFSRARALQLMPVFDAVIHHDRVSSIVKRSDAAVRFADGCHHRPPQSIPMPCLQHRKLRWLHSSQCFLLPETFPPTLWPTTVLKHSCQQ